MSSTRHQTEIKYGIEAAQRDHALGAGRSARCGNIAYDAAYDREWTRLQALRDLITLAEAIEAFWKEGDAPLSPYALIAGDCGIARELFDALNAYRSATR